MKPSRRVFLKQAGKVSLFVVSAPIWQPWIVSAEIEETPPNTSGPYYVPGAPAKTDLRESNDQGQPLVVSGRVIDTNGKALPKAQVEIWHSDAGGQYDMDGFRYRAKIPLSDDGNYRFATFLPGQYGFRPQHIHYKISTQATPTLFTQLYFENDPFFQGNPKKNYTRDPIVQFPQLIRPVKKQGSELLVYFQITLRPA